MPFLEDESTYRAKVEKFMREHPDATEADLKALFPRMNSAKDIWARFNGSATKTRRRPTAKDEVDA